VRRLRTREGHESTLAYSALKRATRVPVTPNKLSRYHRRMRAVRVTRSRHTRERAFANTFLATSAHLSSRYTERSFAFIKLVSQTRSERTLAHKIMASDIRGVRAYRTATRRYNASVVSARRLLSKRTAFLRIHTHIARIHVIPPAVFGVDVNIGSRTRTTHRRRVSPEPKPKNRCAAWRVTTDTLHSRERNASPQPRRVYGVFASRTPRVIVLRTYATPRHAVRG